MTEDIVFRLIRGGRFGEPISHGERQIDQGQDALRPVSVQLMRYASRLAEALEEDGRTCKLLDNRKDVLMEVNGNGKLEGRLVVKLRDSLAAFRRFGERHYLCTGVEDLEGKPIDVHRLPSEEAIRHIEHRLMEAFSEGVFSGWDDEDYPLSKHMRIEASQSIPIYYSDGRIEAYRKHIEGLKAEIQRLAWQPASPLKPLRERLAIYCNGIAVTSEESEYSTKMGIRRREPHGNIQLLTYAINLAYLLEGRMDVICAPEESQSASSRLYLHLIDRRRQLKIALGSEPLDHVLVLLDVESDWRTRYHSRHKFLILGSFEDFDGCPLDLEQGPDDDILRYVASWIDEAHEKRQEIFLP